VAELSEPELSVAVEKPQPTKHQILPPAGTAAVVVRVIVEAVKASEFVPIVRGREIAI
jgi:hypothetical protein